MTISEVWDGQGLLFATFRHFKCHIWKLQLSLQTCDPRAAFFLMSEGRSWYFTAGALVHCVGPHSEKERPPEVLFSGKDDVYLNVLLCFYSKFQKLCKIDVKNSLVFQQ